MRPIIFSNKTFDKLPEDLQAAVLKAGKEAGDYGREIESREDGEKLKQMADAGDIEVQEFADRDKLLELIVPVHDAYASELGAEELLEAIRSM